MSIKYATKDQTATAGKDYCRVEGTLTFAHGQVTLPLYPYPYLSLIHI